MMGPVAPCRRCEVRTAECHATCERYKEYEGQREEFRQQNWKDRKRAADFYGYRVDRMLKTKKRGPKE